MHCPKNKQPHQENCWINLREFGTVATENSDRKWNEALSATDWWKWGLCQVNKYEQTNYINVAGFYFLPNNSFYSVWDVIGIFQDLIRVSYTFSCFFDNFVIYIIYFFFLLLEEYDIML